MSRTAPQEGDESGTVVEEYVADVRIRELPAESGDRCYRFEAPDHCGETFSSLETARIYADVYFAANGFQEAGTGELGVPPEVLVAGKDVTAAYLVTQPGRSKTWVASYYGTLHQYVEKYLEWVQRRARAVRTTIREENEDD